MTTSRTSRRAPSPSTALARLGPLVAWLGVLMGALVAMVALGPALPAPHPTPGGLHQAVAHHGPLLVAMTLLRVGCLVAVVRELLLTAIATSRVARSQPSGARAPEVARLRHRLAERALGKGIAIGLLGTCSPTLALAAGASPATPQTPPASTSTSVPSAPVTVPSSDPAGTPVADVSVARMVPLDSGTTHSVPASDRVPAGPELSNSGSAQPEPAGPEPVDSDGPVAVMVVLDGPVGTPPPPQVSAPAADPPGVSPTAPQAGPSTGHSAPSTSPMIEDPQAASGSDAASDSASDHLPDNTAQPPELWEVSAGDHLWSIAAETLADHRGHAPADEEILTYWVSLIEANRGELVDPDDADLLIPGQVLHLPPVPASLSG